MASPQSSPKHESAGRVPFYVDEDGQLHYCFLIDTGRIIDGVEFWALAKGTVGEAEKMVDGKEVKFQTEERDPRKTANREAFEEIGYPIRKLWLTGKARNILRLTGSVLSKRGKDPYPLHLWFDQVDGEHTFTPKPIEVKHDHKVRPGNNYEESGRWGTLEQYQENITQIQDWLVKNGGAPQGEELEKAEVLAKKHKLTPWGQVPTAEQSILQRRYVVQQIRSMKDKLVIMAFAENEIVTRLQQEGTSAQLSATAQGVLATAENPPTPDHPYAQALSHITLHPTDRSPLQTALHRFQKALPRLHNKQPRR